MPSSHAITSTTQEFLDIYDVTDDLLLLKRGAAAVIVQVTAMNFGLLAEEEQDAIIYGYAGLLNSLNYPIQIVIRSQTKDITSYLELLRQKEEETVSAIRKSQIRKYREFVAELVQERNVLDKKFYVVIPANGLELGITSTSSIMPGVKSPDISTFDRSIIVERAKNILDPKRDHIISQFARIGLFSRQLNTQEIIQLFYAAYNPETSDGQKMTDSRQYTSTAVEGSLEEKVFGPNRAQQPLNMRPMQEQDVQEMNASVEQPQPTQQPQQFQQPDMTQPVEQYAEQQQVAPQT